MRRIAVWATGIALAIAAPAGAQRRTIEAPAGSGWTHAATGVSLGAGIAGYPRTALEDYGAAELDVIANFGPPDDSTSVTIYLFRPTLLSVPVWFDRSETQILARDVYGSAQPLAEPRAFAPPGARTASGLSRVYQPSKGPYKSTGLAMMPLGEWLVAVRISSSTSDAAALDAKLHEVVAAIGWPSSVPEAPAAVPIEACSKPLAYKRAKLRAADMASALMSATLATQIQERKSKAPTATPLYCRDLPPRPEYGVYRLPGSDNAYVMAVGDAGRTIRVEPSLAGIVSGDKGYSLSFVDLEATSIFPSFDKLASPDQALQVVTSTNPVSRVAGKNIVIDSTGP